MNHAGLLTGDSIDELERLALDGVGLVLERLESSLRAVIANDVELATRVITGNDSIDEQVEHVRKHILSVMASESRAAGDLRRVAALLHVIGCVERMGNECVSIAKLTVLRREVVHDAGLLDVIDRFGEHTRLQILAAREAFGSGDVALANELAGRSAESDRLNRELYTRTAELGHDRTVQEWALLVCLLAGCLERLGAYAVDIAEQTVSLETGLFRELADEFSALGRAAA